MQTEEQQTDETYEQFEERVLNKRAAHMYHSIKNKLENKENMKLSEMTYKNGRKQVRKKKLLFLPFSYSDFGIINFKCVKIFKFFILGCTKVLHYIGTQKVPSIRDKSRELICRNIRHQRPKVGEPITLNVSFLFSFLPNLQFLLRVPRSHIFPLSF